MAVLATAITGLFTSLGFSGTAAAWLTAFVGRVALSIGFSALSRALQKKPKAPGITTETTQTGGTDPQAFILGRYATGGQLVTPPMTHGNAGETPNAYLTYVIALSDAPGCALSRIMIDGAYGTIGTVAHPDYGLPVTHKGKTDRIWVKFYDGSQTAADPMLMAKYGAYPQRPWQSDMIGTGTCYAIVTFLFDRELFKGFPGLRFELDGIPLYDPRQDPSVGGVGGQSWTNPSTWARTDNPVVMAYNIRRGIALPGGDTWGGGSAASDLPLANWFAAMNTCDDLIAIVGGGTQSRYRAGYEVAVDEEPAEVLAELLKTCAGRDADIGGTVKLAVGAPGLPVKAINDADIIVTDEQTHALFPSLAQTHNGVHATFPDPAALWESRDAPPRYDAASEAADGRRLIANVALPACPYGRQVQRLMRAWLNEERRFRRHQMILPPDAAILEPNDVISWTSVRNGYSSKLFEVVEIAHDPVSLLQLVSLREVDPTDYDWNQSLELPWVAPTPGTGLPPAQSVPGFAVIGTALDDASGAARRPALHLSWTGAGNPDVSALEYEIRRLGGTQVVAGVTTNVSGGSQIVSAGIIPDTTYEVRARFIAPRPTIWTAWLAATTPPAYITVDDFQDFTGLFQAAGLTVPRLVSSLPPSGAFQGELVYLTTDNRLYRWDGTQWTAKVPTTDLTGLVTSSQLVIADTSNLVEDPGFELQGAAAGTFWGQNGMSGFAVSAADTRSGNHCMIRSYAGAASTAGLRGGMVFDARPGDKFRLSGWLKRSTDGVCTTAGTRVFWLDANKAQISASAVVLSQANLTTAYQLVTGMVAAPAGAVYGRVELLITGQTAGTIFWDDIYCYRANGGELIVDGTISGNHIAANTITGGLIAATGIITQVGQIADAVITNAKIANATIQGAKIANLAVDTLQVANAAISTFEHALTAGSIFVSQNDGEVVLQTLVVNKGRPDPLPLWFRWVIDSIDFPNNTTMSFQVRRNGVLMQTGSAGQFIDTTTALGTFTYTITVSLTVTNGPSFGATFSNRLIAALNILK